MLDFGPTIVTGDALTNSPYHSVNGSFSGTVWNSVEKAAIPSGKLIWADGTPAALVGLRIGVSAESGVTMLNLPGIPTNSHMLAKLINNGVYEGTSAGRDAIFHGKQNTSPRALGVQVNGLAPGRYEVYVVARNTNLVIAHTQQIYVGTASNSAEFNFAAPGYTSLTLAYARGAEATNQWVDGANYLKFTVTVNAGDALNIASVGGDGGEKRGFINCVQIVSVPSEPATAAKERAEALNRLNN